MMNFHFPPYFDHLFMKLKLWFFKIQFGCTIRLVKLGTRTKVYTFSKIREQKKQKGYKEQNKKITYIERIIKTFLRLENKYHLTLELPFEDPLESPLEVVNQQGLVAPHVVL